MNQKKENHKHIHDREEILENIASVFHPLINDHYHLWLLMDQVREGFNEVIYQKALTQIAIELDHHFEKEEKIILPELAKYISNPSAGPVIKLIDEHQSIRTKFSNVKEQARRSGLTNQLSEQMNILAYLIKKHIEKEDHYFFPMLSLILSSEDLKQIKEGLDRD